MKILVNHIGFERNSSKQAIIEAPEDANLSKFYLKDYTTKEIVHEGILSKQGCVNNWYDWHFWNADFSDFDQPGIYYIEVPEGSSYERSYHFRIEDELLEKRSLSDILNYYKSQRVSGIYDEADRNIHFYGDREDRVDLRGGWYDAAGDFSKYFTHLIYSNYLNPQQSPIVVWSLTESYLLMKDRNDSLYTQHVRRLLEEALFGADFLVRMQDPKGYFYALVSDSLSKKPEDRMVFASVSFKGAKSDRYQAAYRMGAGIAIAALARVSTLNEAGDYSSEQYLNTAIKGFDHLEIHNQEYAHDGKDNIIDDYCALLAASELFRATKEDRFMLAARSRANSLMNRMVSDSQFENYWQAGDNKERPYFHPAEAGLPIISLVKYLEILDDKEELNAVLNALKKSIHFELNITKEVNNPFGYARQLVKRLDEKKRSAYFLPHNTETGFWWQGENARLGSLASAFRLAANLFKEDKQLHRQMIDYAWNQLHWILGMNPFDVCMLHGKGWNNAEYLLFFPNAPGGICNGITSGFDDEDGIAFLPDPQGEDPDHNWRWSEQWVPHAAWFLYAICLK